MKETKEVNAGHPITIIVNLYYLSYTSESVCFTDMKSIHLYKGLGHLPFPFPFW